MRTIYLDNAATTPIAPEVQAALAPYLAAEFGNPSSRHPLGVRAAEAVDTARGLVARAVGAERKHVRFTSGGTEANNLAVLGSARARRGRGKRIVVGPTEHPSVRAAAEALIEEGFEVVTARLDASGALDLDSFEELVDESTVLVAQMFVNNEFGSLYPVREVVRIARRRAPGAHVHIDAVQALGKIEVSVETLGADTLTFSGHKVHAPKGIGALVLREGAQVLPIVFGGGQESNLRSGTENVAGIVALGVAAAAADEAQPEAARSAHAAREALSRGLESFPGARLVSAGPSIDFVCAVELPGPPAEVWQHHLETKGVYTSVGSACQSNSKSVSPALRALGLDEERARRVMRFSFSRETTTQDVEAAVAALHELSPTLVGGPR